MITKKDKKRVAQGRRRKPNAIAHSVGDGHTTLWNSAKHGNIPEGSFSDMDKERCKAEIQCCVEKLLCTDFYQNLVDVLTKLPDTSENGSVREMVCYGVGNFSTASAPMWQYACILNLKSDLAIENVFYYDPCTTGLEAEVLKEFQIQVIPENERGHRLVCVPTLFYMPHCPQQLYSNVLVSNWKSLENVIFFGNSLQAYGVRQVGTALEKGIEVLLPFLREEELKYSKLDLPILK